MSHPHSPSDRTSAFVASGSSSNQFVVLPLKPVARFVRGAVFLMAAATVLSSLPVGQVIAAEAAEQAAVKKTYSIAAGPLSPALSAFAGAAGINLSSDPALTEGLRTAGLQGSYSVPEGFARLLAGSGLEAVSRGGNVYILNKLPAGSSVAPHEATLPAVTATATASPTTEGSDSYTTRALTIGKMTQSIRETPQSVTVVTRKQMDDQNLVTLEQVLEHTPGITKSQKNFGAHVYSIRGYPIPDTNYLLDGVSGLVINQTGWVPADMAIFDRVEVLRGAGGLIVGAGDPSGVINMVRKRPKAEKHFDVMARVGSWNNFRMEVDAGGALNDEATVRGRVVAAYQDNEFFYDVTRSKQPLLYGVVDMDLSRDTTLTVGLRHQETNIDGYSIYGLPRFTDGSALNVPRSTHFTQGWNRHEASIDEVFTELEHRFAGDWKAKLTATYSKTSIYQKLGTIRGAVDPAVGTTRFVSQYFMNREIPNYGIDANASGSFKAWGRTHKAMFGANWSKSDELVRNTTVSYNPITQNIPVDIYNPNHWLIAEPTQPAWANRVVNRNERFGVYGSTRWELADDLHLLLGGRFSWFKYRTDNLVTNTVTNNYKQDAEFTPYAGLVYDLSKQWSVYTSYADTFEPQSQYPTVSGAVLKPAVGSNVELGIKGELYDGRLNVTAAVFRTKKKDMYVLDTANNGLCAGLTSTNCFKNSNFWESSGFEVEVGGQLAPGWQATAGYTRMQTADNQDGQPVAWETPKHLFRASTNYRLPGEWGKWSIGGGVVAQSDYGYQESATVRITQGGYSIWNAFGSYKINDKWTASLNIDNLFDKNYFAVVGGSLNGGYFGTPRNVMLTMRGSF